MTEPEKIKVNKPIGYNEIPMPAPNGSADEIPKIIPSRRDLIAASGGFEPIPAKDSSADLIEAAGTVFRVITAKIAFHKREIERLEGALAPYASHARQSAAPSAPSEQDAVEALSNLIHRLQSGDQK